MQPNIGVPQYITETLTDIQGEIDSNTIIVGDFKTRLTPVDKSSKQKINKETRVLNDTFDEMHSNAENTSSSQVHMEHSPG